VSQRTCTAPQIRSGDPYGMEPGQNPDASRRGPKCAGQLAPWGPLGGASSQVPRSLPALEEPDEAS
jgi:hypothetical protein